MPRITGSVAFKADNGLLLVTFDESTTTDTTSCCGTAKVTPRWSTAKAPALSFTVQVRPSGAAHRWRTLLAASTRRSLRFTGQVGTTYQFRVRAAGAAGLSRWSTARVAFVWRG